MKKSSVILIILAFILIPVGMYVSYQNDANQAEQNIITLQQKSESTLSNFATNIAEIAQVPAKYKNDLVEVVKANIQSRYGQDGAKATMLFLQENNLQLDSNLYLNIQNAMNSGHKDFKLSQDRLMDVCNVYKVQLGNFLSGFMMRLSGYPKINLNDHCKVVSDEKTEETFKTKKQTPISIN